MEKLKTGDIILCHGQNCLFSDIIEIATNSPYSHVGIIYREDSNIYFLESGLEYRGDKPILGVQITEFRLYSALYDEVLTALPIENLTVENQHQIFQSFKRMEGTKYDTNPLDFLRAYFKLNIGDVRSTSHFFCSAFVSYILSEVGIVDRDIKWDLETPKDIEKLELLGNYKFGEKFVIENKKLFSDQ